MKAKLEEVQQAPPPQPVQVPVHPQVNEE
jgi:hypothetical protein